MEKTDDEEPKTERFNMFMSKSEMDAIDEWAWQNRIRSKSSAVRRLVQIGLVTTDRLEQITGEESWSPAGAIEKVVHGMVAAYSLAAEVSEDLDPQGNDPRVVAWLEAKNKAMKIVSEASEAALEFEIEINRLAEFVSRAKWPTSDIEAMSVRQEARRQSQKARFKAVLNALDTDLNPPTWDSSAQSSGDSSK